MTDRKQTSGRASNKYDLDKYNKESRSAAVGNFMQTFSRTKTGLCIKTWDDTDYFHVLGNFIRTLNDVSGAVDAATTIVAQWETILDAAWHAYYTNANLKDRVDAEEAAWKLYFTAYLFIAANLQIQYNMRCYLSSYTESDTTPGANSQIPYFKQSSFDIFVSSMKEFPAPKGVYEIVDIFLTWVVVITQEYEKHTLRIPPMIIQPFNSVYDLEDLEAARGLLRVNLGNYVTHAKKFGLKSGAWRDPVKPTEKDTSDVDVIAFFNNARFNFYDDTPAVDEVDINGGFPGGDLVNNYLLHEYYFKDNPNESKIHAFAPWFGTYDGTNNPYGGVIGVTSTAAVLYNISSMNVAQYGAAVVIGNMTNTSAKVLMMLHKCSYDNVADTFHVAITGTNITAIRGQDDVWPLAYANKLFYANNRTAAATNNDLLNLIGRSLV